MLALWLFCACLLHVCNGIYTPGESKQSPIKSKFVQYHQNYSKVKFHNNVKKPPPVYVTSDDLDGNQKFYPVYNELIHGPQPEFQSLKIYSSKNLNRLNNSREENIRKLQEAMEKPKTKIISFYSSPKRKKEIQKEIEVYSKCPSGVTGQFVYDLSCHQFLNCWKGRGIVQNCAPGTLFNPKTLECDFPNKVECITGARQNAITIQSSAKLSTQPNCPPGFTGLIPNYSDCSKFIQCNFGTSYSSDCPPGTLFDVTKNVCDHARSAICVNADKQPRKLESQWQYQNPTGKVNIDSKLDFGNTGSGQNQYHHGQSYGSNAGQSYTAQGLNGHQNGYQTYGNIYQNNYQGGIGQNPGYQSVSYQQTAYQSPNRQNTFSQSSYNQNTNGYHHNTDQTFYGQSRPIAASNQGSLYQGSVGYGQNIPHRTSTTTQQGNYQSHSTKNYETVCNINDRNCGSSHNPKCPSGFQGLLRHPSDCSKFLNCANGQTFVQDCGPGTVFNPAIKACDYPRNVYCSSDEEASTQFDSYAHTTTTKSIEINPNLNWNNKVSEVEINYGNSRPTTSRPYRSTTASSDSYQNSLDEDYIIEPEAEATVFDVTKSEVRCDQGDFHCTYNYCVTPSSVCDGTNDCGNGKDELNCAEYLDHFKVWKKNRLAVKEKEIWRNVTHATCAVLCLQSSRFECRSFTYRTVDRTCILSDLNIGLSGMLMRYDVCDYYELKSKTIDCSRLHVCSNNKCISSSQICDGFDDCPDRADEKNCRKEDLGYEIKLRGTTHAHKGRIEVTVFDKTGYVCDDRFGLREADVVCRELGFELGAAEVKGSSHFAKDIIENGTFYMMDDVNCLGNETSLKDCDFSGWGVHNCMNNEIAGLVCKIPQQKCPSDHWQCKTGKECVNQGFVCDGLYDCTDNSDEDSELCDAPSEVRLVGPSPSEGRLEIKHHGIWGTVCDDDFNEDAAKVACMQLGFHGSSYVKKDGYYGQGTGPIWLDQVYCYGNETGLENCTHWNWGEHNCDHTEDVGIICNTVDVIEKSLHHGDPSVSPVSPASPPLSAIIPESCGFRKDNQFMLNDDVHFRVVKGSVARQGDYPWQAALRIKTNNKPSHWCGAIIISSKFVLTAAHCLVGYPKGAYMVVAGDYNVDDNEGTEQTDFVEDFFTHEKFRDGHKMNNDIALVKLKRGFKLNQDIQPICLPDADCEYKQDMNCTISGFGSTESGISASSHNLRAGWVPIQSDEVCKMPHVYGRNLMEGMFCAGHLEEGVDACDGDSGGPLACLNNGVFTLYGITSWGQHCGFANKPGVYVKVSHYRQWIDNVLQKHS